MFSMFIMSVHVLFLFIFFFFVMFYCSAVIVVTSYPEIEFFKDSKLRQIISDVLFCYSKAKPAIGYRQVCN